MADKLTKFQPMTDPYKVYASNNGVANPTATTNRQMMSLFSNWSELLQGVAGLLWQPETVYALNEIVISPSMPAGAIGVCTTAGTSGASEPEWTAVNTDTADGSAKWRMVDFAALKSAITDFSFSGHTFTFNKSDGTTKTAELQGDWVKKTGDKMTGFLTFNGNAGLSRSDGTPFFEGFYLNATTLGIDAKYNSSTTDADRTFFAQACLKYLDKIRAGAKIFMGALHNGSDFTYIAYCVGTTKEDGTPQHASIFAFHGNMSEAWCYSVNNYVWGTLKYFQFGEYSQYNNMLKLDTSRAPGEWPIGLYYAQCVDTFDDKGDTPPVPSGDYEILSMRSMYQATQLAFIGGTDIRIRTNEALSGTGWTGSWTPWTQLVTTAQGIVAANLAQNGYVKFANGLIVQWGRVNYAFKQPAENSTETITFPIAFSKAPFSVTMNSWAHKDDNSKNDSQIRPQALTNTNLTGVWMIPYENKYSGSRGYSWIVIGV